MCIHRYTILVVPKVKQRIVKGNGEGVMLVMVPLRIEKGSSRYDAMIGVGGIGSGSFFQLKGNHTLGREESRSGRFLKRNDYCKLHIVSHYVKTLLGPDFETIPVGKVGDDDVGRRLYEEMRDAGLDTRYVEISEGKQTLFSFCFIYPDRSGGNLTTADSACSKVTPDYVQKAEGELRRHGRRGIALAVPEVGLAARRILLELGTRHELFCVASFSSGEIEKAKELGFIPLVDLLALNLDEARMAGGIEGEQSTAEEVVEQSVEVLTAKSPKMFIAVTAGRKGSWAWDGKRINYCVAPRTEAISTAGAGDAFLAGILCGLTAGLSLHLAQELGTLVGALSVCSPHTIHKGIDRSLLHRFSKESEMDLSEEVERLLEP